MRTALGPIFHKDEHTAALDREAQAWFEEAIALPLEGLFDERENAVNQSSVVATALLAGVLWYFDGVFGGKLNAAISRELRDLGARLTPEGNFKLNPARLTPQLRAAIGFTTARDAERLKRTRETVSTMRSNIKRAVLGVGILAAVRWILHDLGDQTKGALEKKAGLKFEPSMADLLPGTPFAEEFQNKVRIYTDLRLEKLDKILREGGRPDEIKARVDQWKKQTKRGLTTLSEHQAAVIVTAHRRALAERLGISEYQWRTMRDQRVRKCHRLLEGEIFNWDNPPVIDDRTGFRGHPGEAANCRCIPLLLLTHA